MKYTSKFLFNWIFGYEINGVSNTIFASDSGIGLNNLFKSCFNVKIYPLLKDIGKCNRPKSIKNLKDILYIFFQSNRS